MGSKIDLDFLKTDESRMPSKIQKPYDPAAPSSFKRWDAFNCPLQSEASLKIKQMQSFRKIQTLFNFKNNFYFPKETSTGALSYSNLVIYTNKPFVSNLICYC